MSTLREDASVTAWVGALRDALPCLVAMYSPGFNSILLAHTARMTPRFSGPSNLAS